MDQYIIEFKYNMLYFDMVQLIELIKSSNDDNLECYLDSLQRIVDQHTPN